MNNHIKPTRFTRDNGMEICNDLKNTGDDKWILRCVLGQVVFFNFQTEQWDWVSTINFSETDAYEVPFAKAMLALQRFEKPTLDTMRAKRLI